MAEMLGNRVLPESVVTRRRRVRERINNLRRPVKEFRQENVPGPDVIGKVESTTLDVRDKFVTRDSVLQMIRDRRNGGSSNENNAGEPDRPGSATGSDSAV